MDTIRNIFFFVVVILGVCLYACERMKEDEPIVAEAKVIVVPSASDSLSTTQAILN